MHVSDSDGMILQEDYTACVLLVWEWNGLKQVHDFQISIQSCPQ